MIELLYPVALLIPLLYLLFSKLQKHDTKGIMVSNYELLLSMAKTTPDWSMYIIFLIITSLSLVLATPAIISSNKHTQILGHDIAILLDASDSMLENDRFKISKQIVSDFIDSRKHDRISLTLFADQTYIASPLTNDKKSLLAMLDYAKVGIAGQRQTALYESIYLSSQLFDDNDNPKAAILLTDGLNTVDTIPLSKALKKAQESNIKIYTIGIGEDYSPAVLKQISSYTGGEFFQTKDTKGLEKIYSSINKLEKTTFTASTKMKYSYLYIYPLILASILVALLLIVEHMAYSRIFALVFIILSIYISPQPTNQIKKQEKTTEDTPLYILLDLSTSMNCDDLYPSRIQTMKAKLDLLLSKNIARQITIVGFSTKPYLIAPLTTNTRAVLSTISRLDAKSIQQNGTNILSALEAVNSMHQETKNKIVLLVTDGGEKSDYSLEQKYANEQNMTIVVYAMASEKGGVIQNDHTLLTDIGGNIVTTALNHNISQLAYDNDISQTTYTIGTQDIDAISDKLSALLETKKDTPNSVTQNPLLLLYLLTCLSIILVWQPRLPMRRSR